MKRLTLLTVMTMGWFMAAGAHAVEPAYNGPLGNPEEPALRPYKWVWHGVKSAVYHPVARFNQGNTVMPGIGSVQLFRGAREGAVDLGESTYRGLIFSVPPQKKDAYKQTGKANAYIDQEPLLSTVADLPTMPMKVIDRHPAEIRDRMVQAEQHAQQVREARKQARQARTPEDKRSERTKAQAKYIGERATVNIAPETKRDLTKINR